ncbi:MAG: hypothetical protein MK008_02105 [Bdellovibrionales bacterium]|nr:hypothetical protein [Bdellovibrionales bacterium]
MNKIALLLVFLISSAANAKIFVDNYGRSVTKAYKKTASTSTKMRELRRVGVGLGVSGLYGTTGLGLDLNFTATNTIQTAFGIGERYQTFHIQYKKYVGGESFSPYVGAGYARWYSVGSEKSSYNSSTPKFLSEKFLTAEERLSGEFQVNMLFPSVGVQFLKLNGDWAGMGLFAELVMLIDIEGLVSAPTGGLGLYYYF